ncbi:MAG: CrcB family protein [Natronomonas sp.]
MERRAVTLVALGGFAGATARHAVTVVLPATFPWGTLAVNVVGSFLLGLVVYRTRERGPISPRIRLAVSTGFISSFTTYSTFAAETVGLDPALAALNIAGNYILGFLAVLAALVVIRWRS